MPEYSKLVPSTVVKLLTGVKLNNTYENTIYFESRLAQETYFLSKVLQTAGTYNNLSYQRVGSNRIRLQIPIETAMLADYLMFKNPAFENQGDFVDKWFYAFIKNTVYINNEVTEIEYEIDVIQTWFYDCTLLQSFVEREHVADDTPGLHIVPENIATGEEMITLYEQTVDLSVMDLYAVYGKVDDLNVGDYAYNRIDNCVYNAVKVNKILDNINTASLSDLSTVTNAIRDNAAYISMLYQYPHALAPTRVVDTSSYPDVTVGWLNPSPIRVELPLTGTGGSGVDNWRITSNYIPRNNKLLTYPYRCMRVTNNMGAVQIYKYEDFNAYGSFIFNIDGCFAPIPEIICYPIDYLDKPQNYLEGITINSFIQSAFTSDTFTNWWNANANQFTAKAFSNSVLPVVHGALPFLKAPNEATGRQNETVGLVGGLIGGFSNMIQSMAQYQDMKLAPDTVKGQFSGSGLLLKENRYGFTFEYLSIKNEYLRMADSYFDLYGYACKQLKLPNIHVRKEWTYTKTIGCNIVAQANKMVGANELKTLANIFNRGIRFWTNGDHIGYYGADNDILQ